MSNQLYAVIDLGSNSFHMAVMEEDNGRILVVDRVRDMVQLGYGLEKDGTLLPQTREKALNCLRKFNERLANIDRDNIRAVGTLTLRKMKDPTFLKEAEGALGVPIEIISGREEARLIYLGVSQYVHAAEKELFVIDIGGGSTELILGETSGIKRAFSKEVGCVNIAKLFFKKGTFTQKQMDRALLHIERELHDLTYLMRYQDAYFVGASGTIKTILELSEYLGFQEEFITLEAIERLTQKLLTLKYEDKIARFFDLSPERASVMGAGLLILYTLFNVLSIKKMAITSAALREGMLFDLLGRVQKQDRRDKTIASLVARFGADEAQAIRVRDTSMMIAKVIDSPLMDETALRFLGWASLCHEIGLAVSHHRHFKHSAYLIEHADLDGFSHQDQKILATIIYNHQRKFEFEDFESLSQFAPIVTMILRMAVLFNRGRYTRNVPDFNMRIGKRNVKLYFQEGWLKAHPLVLEDLKYEEKQLKKADIKLAWNL